MEGFIVKDSLSLKDFQLMETMEAVYYSREYITPAEEAYRWYLHNPYTGVVVADSDNIVGFLDILPVSHTIFMKIVTGGFNDRDMKMEDVLTKKQILAKDYQPVSLFLSCAVIHPEYRRKGVLALLLREYRKQLDVIINWGVEFDQVVGDCVTPEGEIFSKKIGMTYQTESDHGTKIYTVPFSLFLRKITQIASNF